MSSSSFFVSFYAQKFKGSLRQEFSKPYRLRGEWEVGVYTCYMPLEDGAFWVFSDIVDFTNVNEVPMQIMDVVDVADKKNGKPMYMKVIKKFISSINIDIKRNPITDAHISTTDITCILHFRKA